MNRVSKRVKTVIVVSIIGIVLLPLALNLFFVIIPIKSASDLNNPEWLNFWGGYLGSTIGGIITATTVYYTMVFYENQQNAHNEEIKRREWLEYMPDIAIYYDNNGLHVANIGKVPCFSITLDEKIIVPQLHTGELIAVHYNSEYLDSIINDERNGNLVSREYTVSISNAIGSIYEFSYEVVKIQFPRNYLNYVVLGGSAMFVIKRIKQFSLQM